MRVLHLVDLLIERTARTCACEFMVELEQRGRASVIACSTMPPISEMAG
jgi:hypothetical protein